MGILFLKENVGLESELKRKMVQKLLKLSTRQSLLAMKLLRDLLLLTRLKTLQTKEYLLYVTFNLLQNQDRVIMWYSLISKMSGHLSWTPMLKAIDEHLHLMN